MTWKPSKEDMKLPVFLHQGLLVMQFLDILKDRYDIDWAHNIHENKSNNDVLHDNSQKGNRKATAE